MQKVISWIKRNKLATILIVIVISLLLTRQTSSSSFNTMRYDTRSTDTGAPAPMTGNSEMMQKVAPPVANVKDRMVIQNSYLSLLVQNVSDTKKQIIDTAVKMGGFMVNSDMQNPSEAATATVSVRVPSNKVDETLEAYRKMSVKVVSESLHGQDVTDEYVDIEERMKTLQKTKIKFEEILDKAIAVEEILNVQRELINLQAQIDALQGQKDYYAKNAQLTMITVYLSTDELALPYAPTETWRPGVIFKEAVRSLIGTVRNFGEFLIWFAVYAIVLVPIGLIIYWFFKRKKRGNDPKPLKTKSNIVH